MPQIATGIGLRHVRIGPRDPDNGTMLLPDGHVEGTVYPGIQLSGAATLTLTPPEPERVPARGDDAVYWTFHLPPTEGWTAELTCSKLDMPAIAMITGVLIWGDPALFEGVPMGTDREGLETDLIMWGQRKAVDTDPASETYGAEVWEAWEVLSCKITPLPPSKEQSTVGESRYSLTLQKVTKRIVGEVFTEDSHGCTKAVLFPVIAKTGRIFYDYDIGDGVQDDFVLTHTPTSATDCYVYVDGVETESGWTLVPETKTVTFTAAPAEGKILAFMYTTADVL